MHNSLLESSADAFSRIYGTNKQTNTLIDIPLLIEEECISYVYVNCAAAGNPQKWSIWRHDICNK